MALKTTNSHLSLTHFSMKDRLVCVECPFVEDLDEDAVREVVFSPGEGHLQILQWLLTGFHPKVGEYLESSQGALGPRTESRLQKLLTVANAMLLCSSDEISVIRGDAPLPQQMAFWQKLLDLYSQRTQRRNTQGSSPSAIIDAFAESGFVSQLNSSWKQELVPKDIRSAMDNSKPSGLKSLMEQSDNLSNELEKYTKELETLQRLVHVQSDAQRSELTTMTQMLSTLVKELGQLVAGFSHCFEARLGLWCQKPPPQLSQLGSTLGRVHSQLDDFIKLFEDLNSLRILQTKLQKDLSKQDFHQVQGHTSQNSDKFQKCLSILEESLHRTETDFVSKYEVLLAEKNFAGS